MREVTINVTDKHIKSGKKFDCSGCPIALAAAEAMNIDSATLIVAHSIKLYTKSDSALGSLIEWAYMPNMALDFMRDFDGNREVKPLSFTVTFHDANESGE